MFKPIDHALTVTEALDLAYCLLLRIRDGESYSMIEYHDKLRAIEKTREKEREK